MQANLKHIAISGNIGSGRTTLTEKLSRHFGWTPLYESVDTNPYLRDFYGDMTLGVPFTDLLFEYSIQTN